MSLDKEVKGETMRIRLFYAIFCMILLLPASAGAAQPGVSGVWARATAGMARAGAAFMTIDNPNPQADALIAAEAGVSDVVELHTHVNDNGVMRMRKVPRIAVPANGRVELKPGGLHVMFIGLTAPLKEGQRFDLTLVFEKAGRIVVPVEVKSAKAR